MFNNIGKLSDEDKKGSFPVYKNGQYLFTVKEVKVTEGEETDWSSGSPVKTGNKVPQINIGFTVTKEDDSAIETTDGNELINPTFTMFIQEYMLGWSRKENKAKEGRGVITALVGVAPDGDMSPFMDNMNAFVGKTIKVYLSSKAKKDGTLKNVVMDPEPLKKK